MYPREIRAVLKSVTEVAWRGPGFSWLRRIGDMRQRPYPSVATIRRPWHWRTLHCVVVYDDLVYDPEYQRGYFMECYERRCWRVVGLYRPADPGILASVRQRRIADLKNEP
jgi:hypothetical protein